MWFRVILEIKYHWSRCLILWHNKRGWGVDWWLIPSVFETWEVPFVKLSTFADDNMLGHRIVEFPGFETLQIADENTFLHVRANPNTLILLNVNISHTTPNSEIWDIWFALVPKFKWSFLREGIGGASILYCNVSINSLTLSKKRKSSRSMADVIKCRNHRDATKITGFDALPWLRKSTDCH